MNLPLLVSCYALMLGTGVKGQSGTFEVTNTWSTGSRHVVVAQCLFPCSPNIAQSELTATITLNVNSFNFDSYNNLNLLSSTDPYKVQNKYDLWPQNGNCVILFNVDTNQYYQQTDVTGQCIRVSDDPTTSAPTATMSSTTTSPTTTTTTTTSPTTTTTSPTTTTTSPTTTTTSPTTSTSSGSGNGNALTIDGKHAVSGGYRFYATCYIPCSVQFAPDELRATVTVDRATSNFDAYGNLAVLSYFITSTSTWNLINTNYIAYSSGSCSFSFQLDYTDDATTPSGSCAVTDGSATQSSTSSTSQSSASSSTTSSSSLSSTTSTTSSTSTTTSASTSTSTPAETTTSGGSAKYSYSQVLELSILFYAAQRSGDLPDHGDLPTGNPIPWRYDSTLTDGQDVGKDLTGGWFDAGDNVKFNFPMAFSTTLLAWGMVQFPDSYIVSGLEENMYDCIKWSLDYFLKCWDGTNKILYGQVGDGIEDHKKWERPENISIPRPTFQINPSNPGSDLAAETAAAMAAGYLAFKDKDLTYANELLTAAKELYAFAREYRGKYSDSIPNARDFYQSYSGDQDELFWGATMLHLATNDVTYLTYASTYQTDSTQSEFSWDNKNVGAQLLMYKFTGENKYKTAVVNFVNKYVQGTDGITITPKGLAFLRVWAPLRYAANAAFIALSAANDGIEQTTFINFAESQINYALGDTGRSYVIGFGANYPKKPHHRASSCPDIDQACGFTYLHTGADNPHTLKGALVGGPDSNDNFYDNRENHQQNEVATDYNAGFQSAVAGLKHFLG